jgi:HK97 family phage prohead protease
MIKVMNKELKFLNIPFEIKESSEKELIIEGHGAVKNNIDSYKDVIVDGAFTKTIKEQGDRIAFCLQHDIRNPIGKIQEIKEDEKGLFLRVKISDAEGGIKTKVKEGILKEMSIGYSVIEAEKGEQDGKEVLFLKQIKLYEVSLVTLAANPLAIIEGMKADGQSNKDVIESEFDNLLAIERNNEKKYEIMKLKALVMSLPLESKGVETPPKEEDTTKDEPPKADNSIVFDSNLFTKDLLK